MKGLEQVLDNARYAFSRLTQREQFIVLGGGAVFVLVLLLGIGTAISSSIEQTERRFNRRTEQLVEVLELQGEYKARQKERDRRLKRIARSKVRLVSVVEEAARGASITIGQLKPKEGEPSTDGIVESRVDLRASGLSADRLQDFLTRLEQSGSLVIVRRLKVNRPYRKETVDIEMTVTTYKTKS